MPESPIEPHEGQSRSELLPTTPWSKPSGTSMMLRSGFGRPNSAPIVEPMALLKALRRRWLLALSTGLVLAMIVGAAAWAAMPRAKYSTKAILRVATTQPKVMFQTNESPPDFRTFLKTQSDMIKSRIVLMPALRDSRVSNLPIVKGQAEPAEWLEGQIQVDFSGSELMMISMSGSNPDILEPIVNAVVASYVENVVEIDQKVRVDRLEKLRKIYAQFQSNLKSKRSTLRALSSMVGTEDRMTLVMRQGFSFENLHSLERDLLSVRADLRKLNSFQDQILAKLGKAAPADSKPAAGAVEPKAGAAEAETTARAVQVDLARDQEIARRFDNDPLTASLRDQHAGANENYQRLRGLARSPNDPAVEVARRKVQAARNALVDFKEQYIAQFRDANDGGTGTASAPAATTPEGALELLRDRIAVAKRTEADLLREIDAHRKDIATLNNQSMDLQTEQEEISIALATAN